MKARQTLKEIKGLGTDQQPSPQPLPAKPVGIILDVFIFPPTSLKWNILLKSGETLIYNRTAPQIWEAALGELQIQVNKPNYHTWLAKTIGLTYRESKFTIGVPSTFVAEYLDKNQRSLIEK